MSSTCTHNMVNFGPLTAEIDLVVWGTPANFNGFRVLAQRYCTASSSGRQRNFSALNRGRHLCSAGRPSRWAVAHILVAKVMEKQIDKFIIKIHARLTNVSELCNIPILEGWVRHCAPFSSSDHATARYRLRVEQLSAVYRRMEKLDTTSNRQGLSVD